MPKASIRVVNTEEYLHPETKHPRQKHEIPFAGIEAGYSIVVKGTKKKPMTQSFYDYIRSRASQIGKTHNRVYTTTREDSETVRITRLK